MELWICSYGGHRIDFSNKYHCASFHNSVSTQTYLQKEKFDEGSQEKLGF